METRNYQGNFTMFWFHFHSVAVSIAYDRSETPQEDYIWPGEYEIDLRFESSSGEFTLTRQAVNEFLGGSLSRHQGKHSYMTLS